MSKMVVVGCRLPHGLIAEVGEFGTEGYKAVKINGIHSLNANGKPAGIIHDGHAFTQVDEAFWNAWREAHKGAPYLKNRLIYAETGLEAAQTATTLAEVKGKTGFEPLDPDAPPAEIEVNKEALKEARASAAGFGV